MKRILVVAILLLGGVLAVGCESGERIPAVPVWFPENEGGTIEEAFGEFTDLLSALSAQEKMVVGSWSRANIKGLREKEAVPEIGFDFYPNKVVQLYITMQDGSVNTLGPLIGIWGIDDGVLRVTIYAYLHNNHLPKSTTDPKEFPKIEKTIELIKPYSFDVIDIGAINPTGYTEYRIKKIVLTREITTKAKVGGIEYRPFLQKILREEGTVFPGDLFMMPRELRKMKASGLKPVDLVRDIAFLRSFWSVK